MDVKVTKTGFKFSHDSAGWVTIEVYIEGENGTQVCSSHVMSRGEVHKVLKVLRSAQKRWGSTKHTDVGRL